MPGNDERPRSRFDMIAEEMVTEPEMPVAEVPAVERGLKWNGATIACPRCGTSAFEPVNAIRGTPMVACRGCPPPAPTYPLAPGVKLATNRYRCGRCGNQPQVTMTLSDVNLYCRGCSQLTLHARQVDPPALTKSDGGLVNNYEVWSSTTPTMYPTQRSTFFEEDRTTPSTQAIAVVVEKMRSSLGLDGFAEFARKARIALSEMVGATRVDPDRRTGRTTRAILTALAWCGLTRVRKLWVRALSPTYEKDLCRKITDMIALLKVTYPKQIAEASREGDRLDNGAGRGEYVYVDHSYTEVVGERELDKKIAQVGYVDVDRRTIVIDERGTVIGMVKGLRIRPRQASATFTFWGDRTPTGQVTLMIDTEEASPGAIRCLDVVIDEMLNESYAASTRLIKIRAIVIRDYYPNDTERTNLLRT